eukprot:SAG11_NODE_26_length_23420_cov_40.459886_8_plen_103_part_00
MKRFSMERFSMKPVGEVCGLSMLRLLEGLGSRSAHLPELLEAPPRRPQQLQHLGHSDVNGREARTLHRRLHRELWRRRRTHMQLVLARLNRLLIQFSFSALE